MATVYKNAVELIGSTPLVQLSNIEKEFHLKANLIAKVEMFNPAGSAKDRVGKAILEKAEKEGIIKEGATIIEATSGNTGIGLACVAAVKGYKTILTMPDTMSVERINLLKAYGAQVVLTLGSLGMAGAIKKAEELHATIENSFIASQFTNDANPQIHYLTTGPEIYGDLDGKVDVFVCGVGTGGTISGVGKYLKEQNKMVKIVAVEPYNSPLLSKGKAGSHNLQGIGANFIPETLDTQIYDEIITVKEEDAYAMGKLCVQKEGLLVGISSGAALFAAIQIAKKEEYAGKNIVVLLPDTGERYLSTDMFTK